MITVGIIGNGFVGNATSQFRNKYVDVIIYDIEPKKCVPENITLKELSKKSDIIFICLPTPMKEDGSCYLGIIEGVIEKMRNCIDFNKTPVVIRSTVPVGTAACYGCFFMPEFLTEANASEDFKNTECWIFGLKHFNNEQNEKTKALMNEILETNVDTGNIVTSDTMFLSTMEAESVKLFKNAFLAVKVGFCNEFYRFCESHSVDYKTVIKGVITDSRITQSHTKVPGNNGLFGFGGTCFPKDISSLQNQMASQNIQSPITNAVIERNNKLDRVEQEWKSDQGRAFINS